MMLLKAQDKMVQCEALTKKKVLCIKNASPNSRYCKTHKNYNPNQKSIYEIKHDELKQELKKSERKSIINAIIIAVITMLIGFFISYIFFLGGVRTSIELSEKSFEDSLKLTEESINQTFLMTSSVILQTNDTINESEGRWYINITNTHPTKETGRVYLYKLEINPDKPSMALDHSLKPGESDIFSLTIKSEEKNISFNQNLEPFGFSWTLPASKVYYVNEHVSISVKITCDNCPSQGIILRVPDFNAISMQIGMTNKGIQSISINTYEWLDYKLEDIMIGS